MHDVEQKIGRNILMFQRIEGILKFLLSHSNIIVSIDKTQEIPQERFLKAIELRSSSLDRTTLGNLIQQFNNEVLSGSETDRNVAKLPEEARISFGIQYENASLVDSLTTLVQERNELIHHFLVDRDLTSPNGIKEAIQYLDQQYGKASLLCKELSEIVKILQISNQAFATYFASEKYQKYSDLWFGDGRRILELLTDIIREKARPDGWTDLGVAGKIIHAQAPEEFTALLKKCNQKTLKGFLLATELFAVHEEPTPKGGKSTFFREIDFKCQTIVVSP